MARHIHHDLIVEWAADTSRVVECRPTKNDDWHKARPDWDPRMQYRLKPEPKPDVVRFGCVWDNFGYCDPRTSANVKLTFSGEDGRLIKAEVIECAP